MAAYYMPKHLAEREISSKKKALCILFHEVTASHDDFYMQPGVGSHAVSNMRQSLLPDVWAIEILENIRKKRIIQGENL